MNKTYKLGSLFDGSGGFPLAGALCGIEPVWASEVEPYPIAVTKSRFPHMKHLGDISKINGAEIEPVDIITFGSPCQDLSVAGKRAGLKHEDNGDDETTRSGLFIEAVRIIKEMREKTNGEYPRFAVWENVPGAFSSNKGEDFRIVLEELVKVAEPTAVMPPVPQFGWAYADSYCGDGWSLAYRVLDAQYWGVPQRRRRIYLVADFGGRCAREILFEREGLRGYFTAGRTPWKAVAPDAERSIGADDCEGEVPYTLKIRSGVSVDSYGKAAGKGALIQKNLSATLGVSQDQYLFQPVGVDVYNTTVTGDVACPLTAEGHTSTGTCPKVMIPVTIEPGIAAREGGHAYEGVSGTLRANAGDNQMAVAYGISAYESNAMKSGNPHSGVYEADTSRTLDLNGGNPACNQGGIAIVEAVTDRNILDDQGGSQISVRDDGKCPTLRAEMHGNVPCVMEAEDAYGFDVYNQALTGDKAKTLTAIKCDADHVPCAVYAVENHPADSRVNIDDSGTVQTLTGRMGTGGGNVPMVMEPFVKSHRAQTADDATTWKHGKVANTLNTFDQGESRASELVVMEERKGVINLNKDDVQSKAVLDPNGIAPALYAGECRGGGGECYVMDTVALEGNGQRPSHRGDGYAETDKSYTLNATEVHGVAYAIDQQGGKSGANYAENVMPTMCSDSHGTPHAVAYGFDPGASRDVGALFIEECGKTLTNGTCPGHHDGVVIAEPVCVADHPTPKVDENGVAYTIAARDYKAPLCAAYQENSADTPIAPITLHGNTYASTLMARDYKGVGRYDTLGAVVSVPQPNARYIVRRLTPTECARLQGFADRWGNIDPKTELTDEEYRFWLEVRKTSDAINGRAEKDYTKKQMLTWYNKLPTDSAEYKMWGNGIALPTALYVIQGVADAMKGNEDARV